jgi:hypothetical protein
MNKDPRYGQTPAHSVFENDLIKLEKSQKALLCDISNKLSSTSDTPLVGDQTGIDCNGNPIIIANSILTTPAPGAIQLVKICPTENRDPEVVCLSNDGGLTIVTGWEVFKIDALGNPTSTVYLGGIDVTGTYQVVPCGVKVKYDYERETICVDGKSWTKVYVFDPSGATPTLVTILWLNENDSIVSAPLLSLINNVNCISPIIVNISDSFGDDLSTLLPSNSFSFTKPECCNVEVVTSIGTFRIIKGIKSYSTDKYDIPFTINSINILSGNCSLSSIHIIGNKTK